MEAVFAKSTRASIVSFVASAASCCLSANFSAVSDVVSCLVSMRSSACLTFSAASRACSGKVRTYCRIVSRAFSTPSLSAAIAESYSRSMSERSASAAIICSSRQRRDDTRPLAALNSLPYRRRSSFLSSASGSSLALIMVWTGHSIPTPTRSSL